MLSALEFFVPEILKEIHPEWKYESLDGILPVVARKTGETQVEIFGQCILISDQTLAPIHLRVQVTPAGDEISWLEIKLGELSKHGMVRTPYNSPDAIIKKVYGPPEKNADLFDWAYKVTFGVKQV